MTPKEIEQRLLKVGYISAKAFPDGKWGAIRTILNGHAISRGDLKGRIPETLFYRADLNVVNDALNAWDGTGRPQRYSATFNLKLPRNAAWDERV